MRHIICATTCATLFVMNSICLRAQVITTIAGTGGSGYAGDNGPAVAAELANPFAIAIDAAGNMYIADRGNNRIRKISTSGIISTVAGTGTGGYNGDNIPATTAQLYDPTGVATDGAGNVYVADKANNRIRKIDNAGIISTVAGNGVGMFSGDGGIATNASLNTPRGIATDATGNLFIADQANQCVRKVNTSGIITTVAGNTINGYSGDGGPATAASFRNPYAVAVDAAGNLYIADVDNARIRKVSAAGMTSTVAGNGTNGYNGDWVQATNATLYEPTGIAIDNYGTLYIADAWNHRIRAVSNTGIISTVAGSGVAGFSGDGASAMSAQLNNPYGIAVSGGYIYVADNTNNRIRSVTLPTSTKTLLTSDGIEIYPNPVSGNMFTINIRQALTEPLTISVTDITGKQILLVNSFTNEPVSIPINAAGGIYFVDANSAHCQWHKKLIVLN